MIEIRNTFETGSPQDRTLSPTAEAHLCETCYDLLVQYGVESVLACITRAMRLRANDYRKASLWEYFRYKRTSSKLMVAYDEIGEDREQIDRIVAEESHRDGSLFSVDSGETCNGH
jgi:hypothetical protein